LAELLHAAVPPVVVAVHTLWASATRGPNNKPAPSATKRQARCIHTTREDVLEAVPSSMATNLE
jgi:hypothetical protein